MTHLQRPLVAALLAFLAGLISAIRFQAPVVPALAAFLASLIWLLSGGAPIRHAGRNVRWGIVALMIATGLTIGSMAVVDANSDCRGHFRDEAPLEATGVLGAAHRPDGRLSGAPLLPLLDASVQGTGCGGELRVRLPAGQSALAPGAPIVVHGRWRVFPEGSDGRWPRDPRFRGFLIADSIRPAGAAAPEPTIALRLRAAADARFARLFPRHHAVVEALVLGRREYMDREMRDRFARAGLSHLLAISGMHVGLLAGVLLLLGSAVRFPRRTAIAATLVLTWAYLFTIGASASALRAGAMITLGLLGLLLQRPSAPLATVSAAALLILGLRPLAILDPGFQLSFAGVLGILLLRRPLLAILPHRLMRRGWLRAPIEAFVVGIAAFVATAPIVAHHFGIVAPVSIVAGVPAVPLMSLALIGAAAALFVSPLAPAVATLSADGAGLALDALDAIATAAAALPFGHTAVGPPPWWSWTVALAAGTLSARWIIPGRPRFRNAVGVAAGLFVLLVWPLAARGFGSDLEIHFIDVGQGDAVAIRTPGSRWILVDAGPANANFDAGERQVVPFLRARGARRIEALILTHPDLDHIGGAPAVFRHLPVRNVFEPGLAVGKSSYVHLLGTVVERDARWLAARSGRALQLDGVRLDMLWPDSETVDANADANEISAIVLLTFGEFSMLLTGDAGVEVESLLVDRYGDRLDVDVLKLGHHGSTTSTSEGLLDVTTPELAVVSAGRRNRYGHPAASVVARVERRGIPIARTDREGTVSLTVEAGGRSWSRPTW